MVCSSCDKQRANLHPKKSKLMPGATWLLCEECLRLKREPRFAIIIAARSNGTAFVSEYITKRRYVGREIDAKEIVT